MSEGQAARRAAGQRGNTRRRVGVVGVPGGWSTEALADAFEERTGFRLVIDLKEVVMDLERRSVMYQGVALEQLDALVVKKVGEVYSPSMLDRLELLRFVADGGVPVFSKPQNVIRLIDRLACTVTLRRAGIPMPPTVVSESPARIGDAIRRFGVGVLKPLYSTKARGMELLEASDPELDAKVSTFAQEQGGPVYAQKKLELGDRDLGVVFMGGQYVGTYARVRGQGAWNTTIHAGGRYERHEPSAEAVEVARRAQALFDLEFTSVDVVETAEGPLVFEVSAFGGYRGLKEGLGIDPGARYAEHILSKLAGDRG